MFRRFRGIVLLLTFICCAGICCAEPLMTYHGESNGVTLTVGVSAGDSPVYDILIHNASGSAMTQPQLTIDDAAVILPDTIPSGATAAVSSVSSLSDSKPLQNITLRSGEDTLITLYPAREATAVGQLHITMTDKHPELEKNGHHTLTVAVHNTGSASIEDLTLSLTPVSDGADTEWEAVFTKFGNRKLKNKEQLPTVTGYTLEAGESAVWTLAFENGRLPDAPRKFSLTVTVSGTSAGMTVTSSAEVTYTLEEEKNDPFAVMITDTLSVGRLMIILGSVTVVILLLTVLRTLLIRRKK